MKPLLLAALLATGVLQDDGPPVEKIAKNHKWVAKYRAALKKYREAEAALGEGDIETATDKVAEIIEDPKIDKRECLLRIQDADGTWDKPEEFFPLKVRAQALVIRAEKQFQAGNKEDGLAKLQSAKTDIDESASRKVPGAEEIQKKITELIVAHSTNDEDPAVRQRRAYDAKIAEALSAVVAGEFAAAKAFYEQALAIDPEGAKAKEGIAKMSARLAEKADFEKLAALPDKDATAKIAACDEFLKKHADGLLTSDVRALRTRLTSRIADESRRREEQVRNDWFALKGDGKFKDALDLLAQKATGVLKAEEIRQLEQETREACLEHATEAARNFRLGLGNIDSLESLAGRSVEGLDRDFPLPDAAQLVTRSPALDWCRQVRAIMDRFRTMGPETSAKDLLPLYGDAVRGAPAAVDKGENVFFRALSGLVRATADRTLVALVEKARTASGDDLASAKADANAVLTLLDGLDAKLGEALSTQPDKGEEWRKRHGFWRRDLSALKARMDEFPRDAAEIDKLAADLADWQNPKGVYGPAPVSALTQIENEFNRIRRKEWDGLSRDSRRRLLTCSAVARALRLLLEGTPAAKVAEELDEYRTDLKEAGGHVAAEVERHGPKLAGIFQRLMK